MPDTLELRAGPHRATVKVGDVVPMTDGGRWYIFRADLDTLWLHKPGTGPGLTSFYTNGQPCLGSGLPAIDIAALAAQPPAVTLTAAQVEEIREAWLYMKSRKTTYGHAIYTSMRDALSAVPGLLEDAP